MVVFSFPLQEGLVISSLIVESKQIHLADLCYKPTGFQTYWFPSCAFTYQSASITRFVTNSRLYFCIRHSKNEIELKNDVVNVNVSLSIGYINNYSASFFVDQLLWAAAAVKKAGKLSI